MSAALNLARRAVVACWPVADQRDHARAVTVALWGVGTGLAAAVALLVALVAVVIPAVITTPQRAARALLARYGKRKHRKAWEDYWRREQSYYVPPASAAQRQRRYRLTKAGVVIAMILACGLWPVACGLWPVVPGDGRCHRRRHRPPGTAPGRTGRADRGGSAVTMPGVWSEGRWLVEPETGRRVYVVAELEPGEHAPVPPGPTGRPPLLA